MPTETVGGLGKFSLAGEPHTSRRAFCCVAGIERLAHRGMPLVPQPGARSGRLTGGPPGMTTAGVYTDSRQLLRCARRTDDGSENQSHVPFACYPSHDGQRWPVFDSAPPCAIGDPAKALVAPASTTTPTSLTRTGRSDPQAESILGRRPYPRRRRPVRGHR